jgi:hypothetical protein
MPDEPLMEPYDDYYIGLSYLDALLNPRWSQPLAPHSDYRAMLAEEPTPLDCEP